MLLTPHYKLGEFQNGDQYSATQDRLRMTTIDNELSFLSVDLIGDGVISGWTVSEDLGSTIAVSSGTGMIEGFITSTYGQLKADLPDGLSYIWMQRRTGVLGDKGAFSPMQNIAYSDLTPPATPATPTVATTFSSVLLSWTANVEPDLDHYDVYRSTDNITFNVINTSGTNSYLDTNVIQISTYYYRLSAIDVNGNSSSLGGIVSATTLADTTVPSDPSNVELNIGDGRLQVLWDGSTDVIGHYHLIVQPLDSEGLPQGSSFDFTVSAVTSNLLIDSLDDGTRYQISLYAVSIGGVSSNGVVVYGQPAASSGPSGVMDVVVSDIGDTSGNVQLEISWTIDETGYIDAPAFYYVTISTGNQVGQPSIYTATDISVVQYTIQGDQVFFIAEDTSYDILVQGADSNGVTEPGFKVRFRTQQFTLPASPTNLVLTGNFDVNGSNIVANWTNSNTSFDHNEITLNRVSLDSLTPNITIESNTNIGTAQVYKVAQSNIVNNARYDFIIVAVDNSGNRSAPLTGSIVLDTIFITGQTTTDGQLVSGGPRPGVPSQQDAAGGNGVVTIVWNQYPSDYLHSYNIYRANYATDFVPASFTKVAVVDNATYFWNDFGVVNGQQYVYFVTVTDDFGVESLNPSDGYIDYPLVFGVPVSHSQLGEAPDISLSASGYSTIIGWPIVSGDFDGFEIWRSEINSYSFVKVGDAAPDDTSFLDTNALLKSGTYYYMIRMFRSQANLVVTTSNVAPLGAIVLASIICGSNSILSVDLLANDIAMLLDPITAETHRQLSLPHHPYVSSSDDRRIRLADQLIISDWTSTDFITYATNTDISDTGSFTVLVNGLQSIISSTIDNVAGTLTFAQAIFTPDVSGSTLNQPVVTAVFANTSEVTGVLSSNRVANISAVKVTRGLIDPARLTNYDHLGRFEEPLLPNKITLAYDDGYRFAATVGTPTTFYDLLKTTDGSILAATSQGILLSTGDGTNTWQTQLQQLSAATKVFYSSFYEWYLGVVGKTVYYSTDLVNWSPISGMSGVHSIRDLTEDGAGNLFASTDAGLYVLNAESIVKVIWLQASIIDPESPDTYALLYDSGKLYASSTSGIWVTSDLGQTWAKTADISVSSPLHSIIRVGSAYFGASRSNIWRAASIDGSFTSVAVSIAPCRKLSYFNGALFVTTDAGLFKSNGDALSSNPVELLIAFASLNRNGIMPAVTSINVIDNRIYLGTDNILYSVTVTGVIATHADLPLPCPTIFVNGFERSVGVFYSPQAIEFDQKLLSTDIVEIATSYQVLTAINGGWADINYLAPVFLHIGGVLKAAGQPSASASDISLAISSIQLVTFNGRNSNFDVAVAAMTSMVQIGNTIASATGSIPATTISSFLNQVQIFEANIDPSLISSIKLQAIGGNLLQVPVAQSTVPLPSFNVSALPVTLAGTYDAVSGTLNIQSFSIDKYDRPAVSVLNVEITSTGVLTHTQIEDAFEEVNSGLAAGFSFVQQANVLKLGLENSRTYGTGQTDSGNIYQASYSAPTDNWYDPLASTVDFILDVEQSPSSIELPYPADVLSIVALGEVWVCGSEGVIAIDTTSLNTRKVFAHDFYIYNLVLVGTIAYALAQDGLYQIDIISGLVTKDVEIDLPTGFNSIFFINDNTLVGTPTGVLSRRPFDIEWHPVVNVLNAHILPNGVFTFVIGQNVTTPANAQVFYATGGGDTWNTSGTFPGILVNSVVRRFDLLYFATDSGIYVQDLSGLFANGSIANSTVGQLTGISLLDVKNDTDLSELVIANDTDADNDRVVIGDSEGNFYVVEGGVTTANISLLPAIHKVRLINGKYWLFGYDLVQIEGAATVVKLSTGKILT